MVDVDHALVEDIANLPASTPRPLAASSPRAISCGRLLDGRGPRHDDGPAGATWSRPCAVASCSSPRSDSAPWNSSIPATASATSTAPSPSTRRSASRSAAGCRSATRRSTSSWACPATATALELTYNHGVDSYELGTGYNHIALTVDDLDGTLERLAEPGHRAREAAVPGARGRLADLLRARPGRLPDRADRAPRPLSARRCDRAAPRGHRPRVELVPARRLHLGEHGGHGWWKRTDEIYEPVRIGEGLDAAGALQPEPMERALETIELFAHFCRATGIDDVRPSPPARSATRRTARSS